MDNKNPLNVTIEENDIVEDVDGSIVVTEDDQSTFTEQGIVDVPWWAILLVLFITFWLYETRDFDFFKKQGIPTLKSYPVVGSFVAALEKGFIQSDLDNYGRFQDKGMWCEFMGSLPSLIVYDEKFMADVMVKEFASFPNHFSFSDPGGISDRMLISMKDDKWKQVRNEITPTFTSGKLKKMNAEINRCAKAFAEHLAVNANAGSEVEAKEYTGAFSLDVISTTAFGMQVDSQTDKDSIFVQQAKKAATLKLDNPKFLFPIFFPELTKLLRKLGLSFEPLSRESQEFFSDLTKQAIEVRKSEQDQSRNDFLQLMINAQRGEDIQEDDEKTVADTKGLTTPEILSNAVMFFVAGYDTTATVLSLFMYCLATHPDCQAKLVNEIDTIIADKEVVDYNLVQEMPYLDQCLNEALRMYPPAMRTNRIAKEDITLHGVFIRKGMLIQFPVYAIHHDPKRWPDPERYDPERFSPVNRKDRNPYHFLPFGHGPRNCIGSRMAMLELKIATVHMLRKVTLKTCPRTQIPLEFATNVLLEPKHGVWLKLDPRDG